MCIGYGLDGGFGSGLWFALGEFMRNINRNHHSPIGYDPTGFHGLLERDLQINTVDFQLPNPPNYTGRTDWRRSVDGSMWTFQLTEAGYLTQVIRSALYDSSERHDAVVDLAVFSKMGVKTEGDPADLGKLQEELYRKFKKIVETWRTVSINTEITITSGEDGDRAPTSKHFNGFAIDLRGRHLGSNEQNLADQEGYEIFEIAQALQLALKGDYDVVVEVFTNKSLNHIHIEYDPKKNDPNWDEVQILVNREPVVQTPDYQMPDIQIADIHMDDIMSAMAGSWQHNFW